MRKSRRCNLLDLANPPIGAPLIVTTFDHEELTCMYVSYIEPGAEAMTSVAFVQAFVSRSLRKVIFTPAAVGLGLLIFSDGRSAAQQANDLAGIVAGITRAYIARCTPDLTSQGMPPRKAEAVCICVSSALSAEMLAG